MFQTTELTVIIKLIIDKMNIQICVHRKCFRAAGFEFSAVFFHWIYLNQFSEQWFYGIHLNQFFRTMGSF